MRSRGLIATVVTLLATAVIPAIAGAAPRHNDGLTIAATPSTLVSGEGVLIYGHLVGPDNAGQRILLYHRINPAPRFTLIGMTRTNAAGYYTFTRPEGIVASNRNWFVVGPNGNHSRTIHEWVSSVVTLNGTPSSTTTGTPVQFTGTVAPTHPLQRVLLQEQSSDSGNGWRTVAVARTDASSNFTLAHAFRSAGSYTLRAYFPADPRNIAGESDTVTVTVQQRQNPSFTISGSAPVISNGQSETISGSLYEAGSTTKPQASVPVTLYGAQVGGRFKALASTTTAPNGNYSFTQMPLHNSVYRVETQAAPVTATADLYVGVQDVLTVSASGTTATVGGTVTITGTVTPDHSGHVIYLQRLNAAGSWQIVAISHVSASSRYAFAYTFGQPGSVQLRVRIPGGPENVGGTSSTVTVAVSGLAPVTSLPSAT